MRRMTQEIRFFYSNYADGKINKKNQNNYQKQKNLFKAKKKKIKSTKTKT